MEKYKKEEIKKIIKYGFDLKLISYELDIPIEHLEKLKKELENEENKTSKVIKKKKAISKIEQMRIKYNKLTGNDEKTQNITTTTRSNKEETKSTNTNNAEKVSKQKDELIQAVTNKVEKITQTIANLSISEKKKISIEIDTELKKIEKLNLTIEQAEKLYNLINIPDLKKLDYGYQKNTDYLLNRQRKIILNKLLKNIQIAQMQTNDIAELKKLLEKLSLNVSTPSQVSVNLLKTAITNKIYKIRKENLAQEFKNNISEDIIEIVKDLANGTIDIEKAKLIIEAEAKRRVKNKPQNKFTLTEEQEKKQILIRIRQEITGNADKYKIIDPNVTISEIKNLCGDGIEFAIKAVVENFLQRKDFNTAESICDTYLMQRENAQIRKFIIQLRKKVKYTEIGDLVLKVINADMEKEEEDKLYEQIKRKLQTSNVKLTDISLGKTKDGLRTIHLSDIWDETEQIR